MIRNHLFMFLAEIVKVLGLDVKIPVIFVLLQELLYDTNACDIDVAFVGGASGAENFQHHVSLATLSRKSCIAHNASPSLSPT